jgi:predicted DCC family thiol-disulfide oxidoreductase YuxK
MDWATSRMENIASDKKIVLFDGVCNLCNKSVQFILKRDKKNQFLFGSLQGSFAQGLLLSFGLPMDQMHSILLVENNQVYSRSESVLRILKSLGGVWSLAYALILIPAFLRDGVYNWIAKNRYHWFGRSQTCPLPKKEWEEKFLN